jgi:hypothetical protein
MDSLVSDEIRYFWMLRRELSAARAAKDWPLMNEALDDLDLLREHASNPHVRARCEATINEITPNIALLVQALERAIAHKVGDSPCAS